jgi:hypothetical protein
MSFQEKLVHFFSSDILLTVPRAGFAISEKIFGVLFLLALGFAFFTSIFAARIKNPATRMLVNKLQGPAWLAGTAGLVWIVARYEYASVLGTRMTALIILIIAGVWKIWGAGRYFWKQYRTDSAAWTKSQEKDKYLNKFKR